MRYGGAALDAAEKCAAELERARTLSGEEQALCCGNAALKLTAALLGEKAALELLSTDERGKQRLLRRLERAAARLRGYARRRDGRELKRYR